jgi:hypothetical protein
MEESTEELRRQLRAAIANVRRQIDVEDRASHLGHRGPEFGPTAADELRAELAQLEDALAGLTPDP